MGVQIAPAKLSLSEVNGLPVLGLITATVDASSRGTKNDNNTEASAELALPVTERQLTSKIPPAPLGLLTILHPGEIESTAINCTLAGNTSVMTKFVMVCPAAMSTSKRY